MCNLKLLSAMYTTYVLYIIIVFIFSESIIHLL